MLPRLGLNSKTLLLATVTLIAASLSLGCTPSEAPQSPQQIAPLPSSKEIVFAGLSGLAPRYIETGPFKGMGWIENHTLEIRKGLEQDGFQIKQEWMTPARIAHEFRVKSPICLYPAEWNRPNELFKKKPDRLYSLALTLGGEEHRSIVFRSIHKKKFQKHVDSKGNLNLEALIHDPSLKTLLIRDKSYGPLTQTLTDIDPQGDQIVRPEFRRNVSLLVIHDNRQILEMLNADRFDYTFSDAIENHDFSVSGLDTAQFTHLNYISSSVRTKDDPNLIQVSIACSDHPETKKALPFMNKWIATFRETTWRKRKLDYQNLLDRNAPKAQSIWEGTLQRFRGQFEKGDLDDWWQLQERHFPGLKKFPDPIQFPDWAQAKRPPSPLKWYAGWENKDHLLIANESVLNEKVLTLHPGDEAQRSFDSMYVPYRFSRIAEYLLSKESNSVGLQLKSAMELRGSFESLADRKLLKQLTVIAPGMTSSQFEKLAPLLSSQPLESLNLFGASPEQTCSALNRVQSSLRSLNLSTSSLCACDFIPLLKKWNLEELHLNNSQVSERELYRLLTLLLSDSSGFRLKRLSLGFLRGSWTERNAEAFGRLGHRPSNPLAQLSFLDLENNFFTDREFQLMAAGIPHSLSELRLGSNHLTPETLIPFFLKPFPHLKHLDLADSSVVTQGFDIPPKAIQIPSSVESLVLSNSGINERNLSAIPFPRQLHTLDLSHNTLAHGDLAPALRALNPKVEFLDLSHTRISEKALATLASLPLSSIRSLRLASNLLNDDQLMSLSRAKFSIFGIDLSGNAFQDSSAGRFARAKGKDLIEMDFSGNLISAVGVREIAQSISPQLEVLKLSSILSLDIYQLASHFPHGLRFLDLSNNQLSNDQIRVLAPRLPPNLEHLLLSNSSFNAIGVRELASHFPKRLNRLLITNTPLDGSGIALLAQAFPQTLRELRFGNGILSTEEESTLAAFLPRALLRLGIEKFSTRSGDCPNLFRQLPQSLSVLEFLSSPLTKNSALALSGHFPPNIREIRFEGSSSKSQDISAVAKNLPISLEQFMFFAANFGTVGLQQLSKETLPNLRILSFGFDRFSWKDLVSVLRSTPAPPVLTLTGIQWTDTPLLKNTDHHLFQKVRVLKTGNSSLSSSEMLSLLGLLPESLWYLDMSSAAILPEAVDAAIAALPQRLAVLFVTGIDVGQIGLEKFRTWKEAYQKKNQLSARLVE